MAAVLDLETVWSVVFALAAACAVMLLLPLGFKWLMKTLFNRDISYFFSFLIVLATWMILSGAASFFDRTPG